MRATACGLGLPAITPPIGRRPHNRHLICYVMLPAAFLLCVYTHVAPLRRRTLPLRDRVSPGSRPSLTHGRSVMRSHRPGPKKKERRDDRTAGTHVTVYGRCCLSAVFVKCVCGRVKQVGLKLMVSLLISMDGERKGAWSFLVLKTSIERVCCGVERRRKLGDAHGESRLALFGNSAVRPAGRPAGLPGE